MIQERLASLINVNDFRDNSGLYDSLARALKNAKIPPKRVLITEYFDPTQQSGGFCDPLIKVSLPSAVTGEGLFDRKEARWASKSVLSPLNAAVHRAAEKHGWRVIFGSQERFRPHGYCSANPWIVGLTESLANQVNRQGTLHSNKKGNLKQAKPVIQELRNFLYKDGKARTPNN